MKPFLALTLALISTTAPAFAADDHIAMASMSMGGAMAHCPAGDPAVIVNTSKMTYMLDNKKNRTAMMGMMDHDKMVCKSKADKMGAHMKGSTMMAHPKM